MSLSKLYARCKDLLLDMLSVSAEAGFYPDPVHLGPAFSILYSSEARTGELSAGQLYELRARHERNEPTVPGG